MGIFPIPQRCKESFQRIDPRLRAWRLRSQQFGTHFGSPCPSSPEGLGGLTGSCLAMTVVLNCHNGSFMHLKPDSNQSWVSKLPCHCCFDSWSRLAYKALAWVVTPCFSHWRPRHFLIPSPTGPHAPKKQRASYPKLKLRKTQMPTNQRPMNSGAQTPLDSTCQPCISRLS